MTQDVVQTLRRYVLKWQLLFSVAFFESCHADLTAKHTSIDAANGSEAASALEKKGFSSLYEDAKNKGHKFLFLTMAGKKTFGCIWPNARKISGRAAESLAPESLGESGRLPELLNSVNISLEVMS